MKTLHTKEILRLIVITCAIPSFSVIKCSAQTNSPSSADVQSINVPYKITLPPVPNPDPIPPRFIPPNPPSNPVDTQIANSNYNAGRISDEDNFQSNNLRIFPNPSAGTFTVNFHLDTQGDLNVKVVDVEGREIFSQNFSDFNGDYSNSFDLTDKEKGIYILSIQQNNHMMTRKIVVD